METCEIQFLLVSSTCRCLQYNTNDSRYQYDEIILAVALVKALTAPDAS